MNLAVEFIRKDTELKKQKRFGKKLFLLGLSVGVALVMIALFIVFLTSYELPLTFKSLTPEEQEHSYIHFSQKDKFQNDNNLKEISKECSWEISKVECVYEKIPYNPYERKAFPLFVSSDFYFEHGGWCRDISLLRYVVLKDLNIECSFNFSEENHVYLDCYENGLHYELNNGDLYRISNGN